MDDWRGELLKHHGPEEPSPPARGAFTTWTPLQGRGELFPEKLDIDNPWQLQNIRSRQWIA